MTSKHNSDSQHIWESDSESFFVVVDPRGDSLGRGTTVSLYLKEEASDFLEHSTITQLVDLCRLTTVAYIFTRLEEIL